MGSRPTPRHRWQGGWSDGTRALPEEVPVALSYNGTTEAVMMATPSDLEEFGLGFSLTEGIATPEEIGEVAVMAVEGGLDVQMTVCDVAEARLSARRRRMAGPVGCGLCGLDSIAAVIGRVATVPPSALRMAPEEVMAAMAALRPGQLLHDATRAVHGAALVAPGRGLLALREDVGRHNALDKLTGAALSGGIDTSGAAVVLSSRVSIDMLQKTAALGAPVLIAASAPTAQAVTLAEAAGITLIGLARAEGFELFTHPARITDPIPDSEAADVA